MMRSLPATLVVGLALLSACMPSDEELGIVQDVSRDPMIYVSVGGDLSPTRRELVLHSDGRYQATCHSGSTVFGQEGVLPALAWKQATAALDRADVWQARSTSPLHHVIRPDAPNSAARIAALPSGNTVMFDGDEIVIEWRRGDGRRKYLYDHLNQPHDFQPYKDLLAAVDLFSITCG